MKHYFKINNISWINCYYLYFIIFTCIQISSPVSIAHSKIDIFSINKEISEVSNIDVRISEGSDDAEENNSTGYVSTTSSDIELISEAATQTVGLRFTPISIPKGITITNAYIQFTVNEINSEPTSLLIKAEASDNANTFLVNNYNISTRPTTTSSVMWNDIAPWTNIRTSGIDQKTPDISSIIQEVINRDNWNSGNALAFIITGEGKRVAVSYNQNSNLAPVLHIEFNQESIISASEAIIIDHNSVDITKIPESAVIKAKNNLHIAYGHTSHGSQLISGMNGLDEFLTNSPKFDITPGLFVWNDGPKQGYLDLDDYAMSGDVGYYPQWFDNTKSYLGEPDPSTGRGTNHSDVNVIIWSWCGQVDSKYASGTLNSDYLTPMSQLEMEYP